MILISQCIAVLLDVPREKVFLIPILIAGVSIYIIKIVDELR